MPQIFKASTNSLARTSIIIGVVAIGGLAVVLFQLIANSSYATRQGEAREQPIPLQSRPPETSAPWGIDCRYCHTGVDNSQHAMVPPTKTCMNCHSQIWINSSTLQPVR